MRLSNTGPCNQALDCMHPGTDWQGHLHRSQLQFVMVWMLVPSLVCVARWLGSGSWTVATARCALKTAVPGGIDWFSISAAADRKLPRTFHDDSLALTHAMHIRPSISGHADSKSATCMAQAMLSSNYAGLLHPTKGKRQHCAEHRGICHFPATP
jgi:hypothetical protein